MMTRAVKFLERAFRSNDRRRILSRRPWMEQLEDRALMALYSSIAFDLKGQEVADIIESEQGYFKGFIQVTYTPGYQSNGPRPFLSPSNTLNDFTGYRSFATAYDKAGNILQEVVDGAGNATQYISLANGVYGSTALGPGVESISVAFEPDNTGVSDVVYENGTYYEFTSTGGSTLVATNVVSASVAFDSKGNKLQDYVTADGVLHEISSPIATTPGGTPPSPTTTTLGDQVVSSGVAFDGNDGVVRAVVFTNGMNYQYDYAGAHGSPTPLFTPVTQLTMGFTSLSFDPQGNETAIVGFPVTSYHVTDNVAADGSIFYLYTQSGSSSTEGSLRFSENIAYSKAGTKITDVVLADGRVFESMDNTFGTMIGTGVQAMSIAFDPSGNEVADVVYQDGDYYEFDSNGGSTLIATDVISASVAIDKSGNKLQDYVTTDGVAHEISNGGTATTIGTNVVTISVAFDGNGGIARSVLFTNGLAYQYDYAGQHLQGQVFNPFLINDNRLALTSRLPSLPS